MNVLVVNAGSSSLKYQLIDMETEAVLAKGLCERIGLDGRLTHKVPASGKKVEKDIPMPTHKEAIEAVMAILVDPQDGVIGTVQLITDQPENQPHRADVAKLLVHEKARRKGAAMALMEELEVQARARGISVLVLDTSTGSGAETFYQRAGWQKVGEIPRYALMPDGAMTATSVFYKFL